MARRDKIISSLEEVGVKVDRRKSTENLGQILQKELDRLNKTGTVISLDNNEKKPQERPKERPEEHSNTTDPFFLPGTPIPQMEKGPSESENPLQNLSTQIERLTQDIGILTKEILNISKNLAPSQAWKSDPATPAQRRKLIDLSSYFPLEEYETEREFLTKEADRDGRDGGATLTKGRASDIIDRAKRKLASIGVTV